MTSQGWHPLQWPIGLALALVLVSAGVGVWWFVRLSLARSRLEGSDSERSQRGERDELSFVDALLTSGLSDLEVARISGVSRDMLRLRARFVPPAADSESDRRGEISS